MKFENIAEINFWQACIFAQLEAGKQATLDIIQIANILTETFREQFPKSEPDSRIN